MFSPEFAEVRKTSRIAPSETHVRARERGARCDAGVVLDGLISMDRKARGIHVEDDKIVAAGGSTVVGKIDSEIEVQGVGKSIGVIHLC